jgi:uncharacterized protein YbbC (DUF1343 family)
MLGERFSSFVGLYPMPSRYALTVGEYAGWVAERERLDLDLTVARLSGWTREMYYTETGLPWVAPSPNIPTPGAALLFSGTCLFEGTNLSEGRGTTRSFELIGAPWLSGSRLANHLNKLGLQGLGFREAFFTPTFSKHSGKLCSGVQIHITDPREANPFAAVLYMLEYIQSEYPDDFELEKREIIDEGAPKYFIDLLAGTDALSSGRVDARSILEEHAPKIKLFKEETERFLLYH